MLHGCHGRQLPYCPQNRWHNQWLRRNISIQFVISTVTRDNVIRSGRDKYWYVAAVVGREHYGHKLHVPSRLVIQFVRNYGALPSRPTPYSSRDIPAHSPRVLLSAHNEDELGILNLPYHPSRPTLGREWVILINLTVNAVASQSIRQSENSILVFG